VGEFLYDLENKYKDKNILIVSHQAPIAVASVITEGKNLEEVLKKDEYKNIIPGFAEIRELDFVPLPHNENYELDLHKPFIDEIKFVDSNGSKMKRVPEVVDCWVESASMPFAERHYPVENKNGFESTFPGDFIAEYISQTRTWFYYMHALNIALFDSISFKNVVTTGNVLASDGTKMSKSKGNYTDPLANFDVLGADALRLYMMGSVVMQAEDMTFKDEEYKEASNRVINILWNTFTFLKMYGDEKLLREDRKVETKNILDGWILSKLNLVIKEVTDSLERYDMVKASRAIKPFIDDFSTWYVRRSRDRLRGENSEDKSNAIAMTRFVLLQFSKIISPITPFISENIYRQLRNNNDPESVHLCSWPEAGKVDEKLIEEMNLVREIVSQVLMQRNNQSLKVRQPLQTLKIQDDRLKDKTELIELIKDEVNIKEIIFDKNIEGGFWLDTTITPELKKEGDIREFVRAVQELRKNKNLKPSETITLLVDTDAFGKEFLNSIVNQLKKPTNVNTVIFEENNGQELNIQNLKFKIDLS